MQEIFDNMNKDIIGKIIPLIDQLGMKPSEKFEVKVIDKGAL